MEWVALCIELVKVAAWPLVVLILGFTLRDNLKGAVDRLLKIKSGENEITFGEVPKVPQLPAPPEQRQLPAPAEPAAVPQLEPEQPRSAEADLVAFAPAGAIINSWSRLEDTMRREAVRLGLIGEDDVTRALPASLIAQLRGAGALPEEGAKLVDRVRGIRNRVAHGASVNEEVASLYVDGVDSIIFSLELSTDIIQVARILQQLKVTDASKVEVGRLSSSGHGFTMEAAREMARSRRGKWLAAVGGATMMITERDAALLLTRGAQLNEDTEQRVEGLGQLSARAVDGPKPEPGRETDAAKTTASKKP